MITNATLLCIDRLTGVSAAGDTVHATGSPISVRCHAGELTNGQKFSLGATANDISGMALIQKGPLLAAGFAGAPLAGDMLVIQADGSESVTYEIHSVKNHQKGSLSHWEVFFKKV